MRLDSWYDSVLKTKGPEQQAGVFVFNAEFEGYNVSTTLLNGRNWNEFIYSVLTNGTNQTLEGTYIYISCKTRKVNECHNKFFIDFQVSRALINLSSIT